MPHPPAEGLLGRIVGHRHPTRKQISPAARLLLSWLPSPRRGGSDMSELGAETMRGIPWPSNGLTEIPFRLYTDPEQYRLEQERIFKGPTWSYLCLAAEIANPGDYVATTIGETAVIVTHDSAGEINAFVNRCAHRGNLLCFERQGKDRKSVV